MPIFSYQTFHTSAYIESLFFEDFLLFYFTTKITPNPHTSLLSNTCESLGTWLWNQAPYLQKYGLSLDDIIGAHVKVEGQVGEN